MYVCMCVCAYFILVVTYARREADDSKSGICESSGVLRSEHIQGGLRKTVAGRRYVLELLGQGY